MRLAVLFSAILYLPVAAFGQDVLVATPVVAATVYPGSAEVSYEISVELPAGQHRLLFPFDFDGLEALPDVVAGPGVTILGLGMTRNVFPQPDVFYSDAQKAARALVDAAEQAVQDQQDAIAAASQSADALNAQLEFVRAIRPPLEAKLAPQELLELADTVQARALQIAGQIDAVRRQIRALDEVLQDRHDDLALARAQFERLASEIPSDVLGAVTIAVEQAQTVTLGFTRWVSGAGWLAAYDIDLVGRDPAVLTINRRVVVFQRTGDPWSDIALTVSTADTNQPVAPREVFGSRAVITEPAPEQELALRGQAPAMDAPVMMESVAPEMPISPFGQTETGGVATVYRFEQPVTILGQEGVALFLDSLAFDAEAEIQASPRYDDTAYLMARFVNGGDEPILAGAASFYRDGELVGRAQIEPVPVNGEAELAFGSLEGIRLEWDQVRNATGAGGIIQRSNTRVQSVLFSVENLTDEVQDVRALYALPYSEQEDLEVDLKTSPAPDETDVDGKRGVSAWDLSLQPGEKRTVDMQFSFDFTEGWDLRWRP